MRVFGVCVLKPRVFGVFVGVSLTRRVGGIRTRCVVDEVGAWCAMRAHVWACDVRVRGGGKKAFRKRVIERSAKKRIVANANRERDAEWARTAFALRLRRRRRRSCL